MTVIYTCAIDVGTKGAVVVYDKQLKELQVFSSPTKAVRILSPKGAADVRNEHDPQAVLNMLQPFRGARVLIERTRSYSGDFPFALASLMEGFGTYNTACHAAQMDIHYVEPKSWKAVMFRGLGGAKATKKVSVKLARHLWPCAAPLLTNVAEHNGRADALNMLYYDMLGDKILTARKSAPPLIPQTECRLLTPVPERRRKKDAVIVVSGDTSPGADFVGNHPHGDQLGLDLQ